MPDNNQLGARIADLGQGVRLKFEDILVRVCLDNDQIGCRFDRVFLNRAKKTLLEHGCRRADQTAVA